MPTRLPAWTRLLLICLLMLQALLPTNAASAPSVAALTEPAPEALPDRPNTFSASTSTLTSALTLSSPSPFTSPLPTPTPQPAPNPRLALDAWADPAWAEPGQVVTFTVSAANTGDASMTGLTLTDALPDGLRYVPGSATGFTYAVSEKRLVWQAPPLAAGATITGSFQARVQGLVVSDQVTNTVTATAGEVTRGASTVVDIVGARGDAIATTPARGGLLRSTDDRLLLRVPRGAVSAHTRFTYAPVADAPNPPPGLRFAFRLEAQDAQGQAVRQFPTPLELTIANNRRHRIASRLLGLTQDE